MIKRYYIAVPNNNKPYTYQTIPTWKNYSFTGSYDDAMITAIQLFTDHGHFGNYNDKDDILFYYQGLKENYEADLSDYQDWDAEEKWHNFKEYYINYFDINQSDDYVSGVCEWDAVSNDFKKNWDDEYLTVIEIE